MDLAGAPKTRQTGELSPSTCRLSGSLSCHFDGDTQYLHSALRTFEIYRFQMSHSLSSCL